MSKTQKTMEPSIILAIFESFFILTPSPYQWYWYNCMMYVTIQLSEYQNYEFDTSHIQHFITHPQHHCSSQQHQNWCILLFCTKFSPNFSPPFKSLFYYELNLQIYPAWWMSIFNSLTLKTIDSTPNLGVLSLLLVCTSPLLLGL